MAARVFVFVLLLALVVAHDLLNLHDNTKYRDCEDVLRSGRYKMSGNYLFFLNTTEPEEVNCDFELGLASILIMQQKYGGMSFMKSWREYEYGFGSPSSGDFWKGLSQMKMLTDTGFRALKVVLQDWNNDIKELYYNYFMLGPASDRYRLHVGSYQSNHILPDDFSYNDNMQFATLDRPDAHGCTVHQRVGWWYNYCTYVLPTGRYYRQGPYKPTGKFYDGIYYKDWHGYGYSLRYIKMELLKYFM